MKSELRNKVMICVNDDCEQDVFDAVNDIESAVNDIRALIVDTDKATISELLDSYDMIKSEIESLSDRLY